nr:spidroin-1-like [Aegilops tauschii subsp. strangulata]
MAAGRGRSPAWRRTAASQAAAGTARCGARHRGAEAEPRGSRSRSGGGEAEAAAAARKRGVGPWVSGPGGQNRRQCSGHVRGEARPSTGDGRGARAVPGGAQDGGEPGGCGHGQVRGAAPWGRGRAPGEPVTERWRRSRGGRGGSVMEAGRLGATTAENAGRRAAVAVDGSGSNARGKAPKGRLGAAGGASAASARGALRGNAPGAARTRRSATSAHAQQTSGAAVTVAYGD